MRERATLIVNPRASRVSERGLARLQRELSRRYELVTCRTEGRGHAVELARRAEGEVVFVFGGDGVFNEALNGSGGQRPLGLLPGGGTNVLPRALGLPADPLACARRLLQGRPRRISLGRVNGRRFGFSAGIGLDAEAVRRVEARGRRPDGRRPGDLVFASTVARILAERRFAYRPALEVAGAGAAALLFVCNGPVYTYAGPLPLVFCPQARFELGLDYAAPRSPGPGAVLRLLARAFLGRGLAGAADVLCGHDLDRLQVRCWTPLPLQADGEDLGDVTEAVFEAERGAVSVLV